MLTDVDRALPIAVGSNAVLGQEYPDKYNMSSVWDIEPNMGQLC